MQCALLLVWLTPELRLVIENFLPSLLCLVRHWSPILNSKENRIKFAEFFRSIFQDMVSMDALVIKIMNFAQRLVDADRASLFLVDSKSKELYATIFDVGVEKNPDECSNGHCDNEEFVKVDTSKEIRFPLGTGIAGQVAMTGEVLNIKDAYADARFNRTVDQLTGKLGPMFH